MANKSWPITEDILWASDTLTGGADPHLPVGWGTPYQYRAGVYGAASWPADFQQLTKAELVINVAPGNTHLVQGARRVRLFLLTKDFTEGSGSHSGWNSSGTSWSSMTNDSLMIDPAPVLASSGQVRIDITTLIDKIVPAGKKRSTGVVAVTPLTWRGIGMTAWGGVGTDATNNVEFVSTESSPDPYIYLTYQNNQAPTAPSLLSPADGEKQASIGTEIRTSGTHNDPDGDRIGYVQTQAWTADATMDEDGFILTGTKVADSGAVATSANPYQNFVTDLDPRTSYMIRERTKDNRGSDWGSWSPFREVTTAYFAYVDENSLYIQTDVLESFDVAVSLSSGDSEDYISAYTFEVIKDGVSIDATGRQGVESTTDRITFEYNGPSLTDGEEYQFLIGVWNRDDIPSSIITVERTMELSAGASNITPRDVNTKQNTRTVSHNINHGGTNFDRWGARFFDNPDGIGTPIWDIPLQTMASAANKAFTYGDNTGLVGATVAKARAWGDIYWWQAVIRVTGATDPLPYTPLYPVRINSLPRDLTMTVTE